jgi:acyl-coenzyme A thioesterase PaaI-like protein
VTDLPNTTMSVPARLGVSARVEHGALVLDLVPQPETLRHGVVRASVLAFVVDSVAGIGIDDDPGMWTLTSDMTVRMRPRRAPARVTATSTVLRRGRRSVTSRVDLADDGGAPIGSGAIGFAKIPRKDTDPPKPVVTLDDVVELFAGRPGLDRPLREAAGVEVIDSAAGVAQLLVTPELRNPAGTLQGAMVALLAEVAVEELASTRFESPAVVTELDLRYLARAPLGPVRTRARVLGDGPDAPVEVELIDTSTGTLTTLVHARAVAI